MALVNGLRHTVVGRKYLKIIWDKFWRGEWVEIHVLGHKILAISMG